MPGAVRKDDRNDAGGRVIADYATDIIINGRPAALEGSLVSQHGKHNAARCTNSSQIVIGDGKGLIYKGSKDTCGHLRVEASEDVFVGTSSESGGAVVAPIYVPEIYPNTPAGIKALIKAESAVSPNLPTYHEDPLGTEPGQSEPPVTSESGCSTSKYYSLKDSKMAIIAQNGYSKEQLECRWIALCVNILDKLRDAGFGFKINSGFRTLEYNASIGSSNASDHTTASAADISLGSQEENKKLFKALLNKYPYSQLIFEGNWVHVAYNGRGPKGASKVMYTYTGKNPVSAGETGQNLPPDLKA